MRRSDLLPQFMVPLFPKSVILNMIGLTILCAGNALLTTVVSLDISSSAHREADISIILTGFPIGFLVGAISCRFTIRRYGHERTFIAAALATTLATLCVAISVDAWALAASRAINGAAMASIFVSCESWINVSTERNRRSSHLSLYMVATSIGVLLGQMFAGLAEPSRTIQYGIAIAFLLAATLFAGMRYPNWLGSQITSYPQTCVVPKTSPAVLRRLLVLTPVAIVAMLLSGTTNINFYALMPLYGERIGLPTATTLTLVSAFSLGGLVAQPIIAWGAGRKGPLVTLAVQGLTAIMLCALIFISGNASVWLLVPLFTLYGAISLTIYPVALTFVSMRLEHHEMVSASSWLLLFYSLSNIIAPTLVTNIIEKLSPSGMFIVFGFGGLLLAGATFLNFQFSHKR